MADAWPATLPPIPQLPVSLAFPNNVIRTSNDVGPAMTRRRSTAASAPYTFRIVFESLVQLQIFHVWWRDTLVDGSLPFTHYYVLTAGGSPATIIEMRFVDPPQVTALGGDIFEAILSVEIMPYA